MNRNWIGWFVCGRLQNSIEFSVGISGFFAYLEYRSFPPPPMRGGGDFQWVRKLDFSFNPSKSARKVKKKKLVKRFSDIDWDGFSPWPPIVVSTTSCILFFFSKQIEIYAIWYRREWCIWCDISRWKWPDHLLHLSTGWYAQGQNQMIFVVVGANFVCVSFG